MKKDDFSYDKTARPNHYYSPVRLIAMLAVAIFLSESAVMLILFLAPLNPYITIIIDPVLLLIILAPAIYFFIFRPMLDHIKRLTQAEDMSSEQGEKFRAVVTSSQDAIIMADDRGKVVLWNPASERMFGYTEKETTGADLRALIIPERYIKGHENGFLKFRESGAGGMIGKVTELYALRKGGQEFPVAMALSSVRLGGRWNAVGILRDLTERKNTGDALRDSEESYYSLFKNMLDGYAYCMMIFEQGQPEDFIYLNVNGAFEKLTGLKDVIGKKVTEVIPGIRESHPELFEIYGRVVSTGKPERFEAYSESFGGWLFVCAYSTGRGCFVATFDNITERKKRDIEMTAIHTLSVALRAAETRAGMLPIIVSQMLGLLKADGALLGLLDPASGDTVIEEALGGWERLRGLRLPPGEEVCAGLISENQNYVNNEARNDPRLARYVTVKDLTAVACVPLISKGHIIGTLMVGRRTDITDEEVHTLSAIGEIAAIAIHRADLYEQTVYDMERLAALHEIDLAINASMDLRVTLNVLLSQVTALLNVDAAAVLLLNPHTQTLEYTAGHGFKSGAIEQTRVKLGGCCAGQAAMECRTVSIPDITGRKDICAHDQMLLDDKFISLYAVPLVAKGQVRGVLEALHRSKLTPDKDWLDFLEALASQAAIAIDNVSLFNDLQRSNTDLVLAYDATIEGWSKALDMRDRETEGHSLRVTDMTVKLARAMGMKEADLVHVRRGALLHDIGKMGIPDNILLKPGALTEEEWEVMRKHTVFAYDLLFPISFLRLALEIPYCHHEKWDGSGYPRGLKEEQIPLSARVFSVVDVWDALNSDRPYRSAWPKEKTLEHIKSLSGKHFDPKIVETFLKF